MAVDDVLSEKNNGYCNLVVARATVSVNFGLSRPLNCFCKMKRLFVERGYKLSVCRN